MRIEDVKEGDLVIPRAWPVKEVYLPGGGFLEWTDKLTPFIGKHLPVIRVDDDDTVRLMLPDTEFCRWWPIEYCDPVSVAVVEDFDVAAHRKQVLSILSELADERKTTAELRKQVGDLTTLTTSLEKQVLELRAEVQKVGKQRQSGGRFALLELD